MSSSQNNEGQIRAAMVDADVVEVMIALPGQQFFNTQIPACLYELNLWPSPGTNSPYRLFVSGLSPQCRRPCRARLRLQPQTVTQAGSMLPEFPAPPVPAHRIAAHSGASNCRF